MELALFPPQNNRYCDQRVLLFCAFMVTAAHFLVAVVAVTFCTTLREERRDKLYKSSDWVSIIGKYHNNLGTAIKSLNSEFGSSICLPNSYFPLYMLISRFWWILLLKSNVLNELKHTFGLVMLLKTWAFKQTGKFICAPRFYSCRVASYRDIFIRFGTFISKIRWTFCKKW